MKGLLAIIGKPSMGKKSMPMDDAAEEKDEGETGTEGSMAGETLASALGISGAKKTAFLSALKDYIAECGE